MGEKRPPGKILATGLVAVYSLNFGMVELIFEQNSAWKSILYIVARITYIVLVET